MTSEYKKVLPYFDLIVGTEEEFFIAGGKTEAMEALREVRGSRRRSSSSSSGTRVRRAARDLRTASWMKWSIRGSR